MLWVLDRSKKEPNGSLGGNASSAGLMQPAQGSSKRALTGPGRFSSSASSDPPGLKGGNANRKSLQSRLNLPRAITPRTLDDLRAHGSIACASQAAITLTIGILVYFMGLKDDPSFLGYCIAMWALSFCSAALGLIALWSLQSIALGLHLFGSVSAAAVSGIYLLSGLDLIHQRCDQVQYAFKGCNTCACTADSSCSSSALSKDVCSSCEAYGTDLCSTVHDRWVGLQLMTWIYVVVLAAPAAWVMLVLVRVESFKSSISNRLQYSRLMVFKATMMLEGDPRYGDINCTTAELREMLRTMLAYGSRVDDEDAERCCDLLEISVDDLIDGVGAGGGQKPLPTGGRSLVPSSRVAPSPSSPDYLPNSPSTRSDDKWATPRSSASIESESSKARASMMQPSGMFKYRTPDAPREARDSQGSDKPPGVSFREGPPRAEVLPYSPAANRSRLGQPERSFGAPSEENQESNPYPARNPSVVQLDVLEEDVEGEMMEDEREPTPKVLPYQGSLIKIQRSRRDRDGDGDGDGDGDRSRSKEKSGSKDKDRGRSRDREKDKDKDKDKENGRDPGKSKEKEDKSKDKGREKDKSRDKDLTRSKSKERRKSKERSK